MIHIECMRTHMTLHMYNIPCLARCWAQHWARGLARWKDFCSAPHSEHCLGRPKVLWKDFCLERHLAPGWERPRARPKVPRKDFCLALSWERQKVRCWDCAMGHLTEPKTGFCSVPGWAHPMGCALAATRERWLGSACGTLAR